MGLFKLKKNGHKGAASAGNVDEWLKTLDQDDTADSDGSPSGLDLLQSIGEPSPPITELGPPPPGSDTFSPEDIAGSVPPDPVASPVKEVWHLPDMDTGHSSGPTPPTSPDDPILGDPLPVAPQAPLPPAWASTPDPAQLPNASLSDLGFTNLQPSDQPPPDLGFANLEPSDLGFADLEPSDLEPSDLELSDFGVVLDSPAPTNVDPSEVTGIAGKPQGRLVEGPESAILPEGDNVATLLAILGLDSTVTWAEVKQSHKSLIADHQAAGESDPARAELARSIRREINSAYIALRLLQVP